MQTGNNARSDFLMSGLEQPRFAETVSLELRRAERYRVFVSMITLDLSMASGLTSEDGQVITDQLFELVAGKVRDIDVLALMREHKLALLLPETQRQGAEAAAKRLCVLIREYLAGHSEVLREQMIPVEMASYPDAAGTRTVADLLTELTEAQLN